MAKDKEVPKEQRTLDREAELAKQQHINDEMEKFYKEQREAAEKALQEQRDKEADVHNIKVVGP